MSITIAGGIAKLARKEAFDEAIAMLERESDRVMRKAMAVHDDDDFDEYERLECEAGLISSLAAKLRRKKSRP